MASTWYERTTNNVEAYALNDIASCLSNTRNTPRWCATTQTIDRSEQSFRDLQLAIYEAELQVQRLKEKLNHASGYTTGPQYYTRDRKWDERQSRNTTLEDWLTSKPHTYEVYDIQQHINNVEPISLHQSIRSVDTSACNLVALYQGDLSPLGSSIDSTDSNIIYSGEDDTAILELFPDEYAAWKAHDIRSPHIEHSTKQSEQQAVLQPKSREVKSSRKAVKRCTACVRCHIYKMKCDAGLPCRNCYKVQGTARLFKQPCFKMALSDVYPFRGGNSRTLQLQAKLPKLTWSSEMSEVRTIYITPLLDGQDIRRTPSLRIEVRRFIPQITDHLVEPFEAPDGEIVMISSPPYACFDATSPKLQQDLEVYLAALRPYAAWEIESTTGNDEVHKATLASDEIIRHSLIEARRYAQGRETIVNDALKIQAAMHITYKYPVICGHDKLDIQPVNNKSFSLHGRVPIPLALDEQFDTLVIRYCERTLKPVLRKLKAAMFTRKDKKLAWYETFLTIIVLLSTLEWLTNEELRWVEKYSGTNKLDSASYVQHTMMEGWRASAKNLIYHFRCVFNGMLPWSKGWQADNYEHAQIDVAARAYIQTISELITTRHVELTALYQSDIDKIDNVRPLIWIIHLFMNP